MIRRTLLVLLFSLVVRMPVRVVAQTREVMSDQQILVKIEHDWDEAFRGRNPGFIETILAEEFVAIYSDGTRGDKAHELSLSAGFDRQIESSTLDDFVVRIYGDTAVVWMSQHVVGISQGRQVALTFRYVDVFVQRGGRWQCVSSQSTKVA
jgi:hypothetical protein